MANQRMFMVCEICMAEEAKSFEDCSVYLTKYYPSSGWLDDRLLEGVAEFFKKHDHRTTTGKYARIIYDSEIWESAKDRDGIVGLVADLVRPADKQEAE